MRKPITILLLFILSLGLSLAGAVSAQDPDVEVAIVEEPREEGGTPVDVVCDGDQITLEVNASANDAYIENPQIWIYINPVGSLEFDSGEYFIWFNEMQAWIWWIGGMGDMNPGDDAILRVIGNVSGTGPITVTAEFYSYPELAIDRIFLDSDSYRFLSVPCRPPCPHPPCSGTIPMQATGTPLALAALALLGIIGGAVYGRIK